jgi:NAD dependent epimerase/dehydratase family enzyme
LLAPGPVLNAEFMRALRDVYNMPLALPTPGWLLSLGANVIGTETELILKSRWVIPARFVNEGYRFRYPSIDRAFHQLFSNL